ncbi:MAG: bifunctional folylpolyglutamate synthase/dihydrofolate synthase, partial [Prolixibacteraceae bacterium]|nr:bifunctional folylpolyglutamate synthase/dihydrofolate synthase [Prolixibacteraceae bacterium]
MNYKETIEYLFTHLPMFQRVGPAAYKNNLKNTLQLDNLYGQPSRRFKSIHVAGTNGKGSVSHMLAAVFQSAGFKTGLYTSPHLKNFRERIKINGKMIPEKKVIEWVSQFKINNKKWNIQPSFFELTMTLAFDYFAQSAVDIAIVEVGMGGRLDSTNIITPELSVITNIGFDHTAFLGDSIEKIAEEKAGIIKPEVPVVIGETQPETEDVFRRFAARAKAQLFFADKEYSVEYSMLDLKRKQVVSLLKDGAPVFAGLKLDLRGMYQKKNLPAVIKTLKLMAAKGWQISDAAIFNGLGKVTELTGLQGRWQIIGANPMIVCDTGHNEDGIREVVEQLSQTPHKKLHFIFGLVSDKDPQKVLALLPQDATYYFTRAQIPRAMDEKTLADRSALFGLKGNNYPAVKQAFNEAKKNSGREDLIFIGGSTFVVAEV